MAAVALIIGAGIVVHKIGHTLAMILHIAINVILLAALTVGVISTVALIAWVTAWLVHWRRQRPATGQRKAEPAATPDRPSFQPAGHVRPCLACGGRGQVLRADSSGRFEPRACPECQPARLAR